MTRWTAAAALSLLLSASTYAAETVAFRVRFGMKDAEPTDWSGKVDAGSAKVESIRGTRWMQGDKADGAGFEVKTRRQQAQSEADRKRVADGGQLPMTDNGFVVLLSNVAADQPITIDAKPGKATFKPADVPLGKKSAALDGNMEIERVPASTPLADSAADEDYPATAVAKDGTVYLAYVAFTRGKDFQGFRERPATPESGPMAGPLAVGPVKKIEKPEDLDYLAQPTGGEQIYLRAFRDGKWSDPVAVTDGKNEYYRPAVTVDGSGKVWVFYSAHLDCDKTLDHGNWELLARSFDAGLKNPGAVVNVSNAAGSDFMPAATTDSAGRAWVAWVGGRGKNFKVHVSRQDGERFTPPQAVSDKAANEWEPAIAAGPDGKVAVAWDTYDKGDYDVYVATAGADGKLGPATLVAGTSAFEGRPSLAYDPAGVLWVAYEGSPEMWGKDFGPLKKKGAPLYQQGRFVAVRAMKPDGTWHAPAEDVMSAMPTPTAGGRRGPKARQQAAGGVRTQIAPSYPRIATDAAGRVYLAFRGKPGSNWRVAVGSVWCEYVTRLDSSGWSDAAWLPRSNNVLDNRPSLARAGDGVLVAFSGDGRGEMNPPKVADPHLQGAADFEDAVPAAAAGDDEVPVEVIQADPAKPADAKPGEAKPAEPAQPAQPRRRQGQGQGARAANRAAQGDPNNDIFVATISNADFGSAAGGPPKLVAAPAVEPPAGPTPDTVDERADIAAMRAYRYDLNGETLRIWRGEFHRHTEYSPDGGGDGGLLDMWRYAIDCAGMDWIGDGDHDYGNGREYSWWTTQKAVTLFTLPGHFVPVFSYERSVVYPEGHRNCMFAQRGVRSLPRMPISAVDKDGPAPDTNLLYVYLHHFKGLCASHTSATNMGTDWRNNDPAVEPFVEIFQGDRNNYERPDAPRSAVTEAKLKQSTPEKESLGGWRPKGFVNLALLKGYRLAFECSSDHVSTHLSYCNVLITGEPTREAVLDAIRKRRVYGSTDNIIADVRCKAGDGAAGGRTHFMGEEFSTKQPPTIDVRIVGTKKITKVVIVKDDVVVHEATPGVKDAKLTWTDPNPTPGKTSYYYVRGEQEPDMPGVSSGELVWASPMWIKYEK
ncbi:MAG TPA: hypothetical protein VF796_01465 [Humisphaera sp.]